MSPKNPHGDLVLSDPETLRAVAQPERYALLTRLQRHGPATVGGLAADLDSDDTTTQSHLDVLAGHGLVRRATDRPDPAWEAVATGLLVELPDDPESQAVARLLTTQMLLEAVAMPAAWWDDDEPHLRQEWRRVAGLINARLWMTPDELQSVNDQIEELTAPYANRPESERPGDARRVRVQCYLMPEPD
jgi:hypothetical protein